MEYKEMRGVRTLCMAEITSDNAEGYVTSPWEEVAGLQNVAHAKDETSEVHYYDNHGAVVVDGEGADVITVVISAPDNKTRAKLDGVAYDETTDMIIRTQARRKYFALAYIYLDTDGVEQIDIQYKGKWSGGNKSIATKTNDATTSNFEYTFTSVHTANKIATIDGKKQSAMGIEVPLSDIVTEEKMLGVFTKGVSTVKALTPDEIKALKA
jgi:hypothetical protein